MRLWNLDFRVRNLNFRDELHLLNFLTIIIYFVFIAFDICIQKVEPKDGTCWKVPNYIKMHSLFSNPFYICELHCIGSQDRSFWKLCILMRIYYLRIGTPSTLLWREFVRKIWAWMWDIFMSISSFPHLNGGDLTMMVTHVKNRYKWFAIVAYIRTAVFQRNKTFWK